MADPYWRYGASADRASIPSSSFPGYLASAASTFPAHHTWASNDLPGGSADFLQKDILPLRTGAYGADDIMGVGVRSDPTLGRYMTGTSIQSYTTPLEDSSLFAPRRDIPLGISPGPPSVPEILNERPGSFRKVDDLPAAKESNVLFVDGLPNDCSRRESGDKATVLCFVEFTDAKCALTALEALQGYKFDNKKPDSPVLRIHFAHFPFRLPSNHEELPYGAAR